MIRHREPDNEYAWLRDHRAFFPQSFISKAPHYWIDLEDQKMGRK